MTQDINSTPGGEYIGGDHTSDDKPKRDINALMGRLYHNQYELIPRDDDILAKINDMLARRKIGKGSIDAVCNAIPDVKTLQDLLFHPEFIVFRMRHNYETNGNLDLISIAYISADSDDAIAVDRLGISIVSGLSRNLCGQLSPDQNSFDQEYVWGPNKGKKLSYNPLDKNTAYKDTKTIEGNCCFENRVTATFQMSIPNGELKIHLPNIMQQYNEHARTPRSEMKEREGK